MAARTIKSAERKEALDELAAAMQHHAKMMKNTTTSWRKFYGKLNRVCRICVRAVKAMEVKD